MNIDLGIWKRKNGGHIYDSSTGFRLPDGLVRSPDAAQSETDILREAQNKMLSYIENGVLLGWLINPKTESVYIYRADGTISKVEDFSQKLSDEGISKGFEFI